MPVKKTNGVSKGVIAKVGSVSVTDAINITGQRLWATRWIAGGSDDLYSTTDPDASADWGSLVALFNNGTTIKNISYGEDGVKGKLWVLGSNSTSHEIGYCPDDAVALARDFDDGSTPRWEDVTFTGNVQAASGGPAVAWGNDAWVAGGHDHGSDPDVTSIKLSTNGGTTWSQITNAPQQVQATRCVCYKSGDVWFAINDSDIWKSTNNGTSWALVVEDPASLTGVFNAMAYDPNDGVNGKWVVVGNAGVLAYSSDDWSSATSVNPGFGSSKIWGVVYCTGIKKWVIVGQGGKIAHSSDATSWTSATSGTTSTLNGIATDGKTLVACADGGKVLISTNGTSWSTISSGLSGNLESIACDIVGEGMR